MKKQTFFLLLLLFSCALPCLGQLTFSGTVIEVKTGDTFVVQAQQTKFTVKLQYVDAPEVSQPLYDIVKKHLSDFILNKNVTFEVAWMADGVTNSRVISSGMDLSLQMLRDGAVWYSVPDGASQNDQEKAIYLDQEKKARDEKLGIWGISGIKPAYQLRLEREEALKVKLEAEREKWVKSAIAFARFNEPVVGMHLFAFEALCGSANGDWMSTTEDSYGQRIDKVLVWTKDREKSKCVGSFDFDEGFRLKYMRRENTIR